MLSFSVSLTLFQTLFLFLFSFISYTHATSPFIYCSEASPSSFGPALTSSGSTLDATSLTIYSTLVKFKLGETTLEPSLAESWKISADGLRYTFSLRKGVQFHTTNYFKPTRPFNADDVLFSFERQWKTSHPYHTVNGGTYEMFQAMEMGQNIKEIKRLDDYTVEFILHHPNAPFLANLAMGFTSIYSAEYAEKLKQKNEKEKIDFWPIGTGPFIFKKYEKDMVIRYETNQNYFLTVPKIKKLIFSITPDASVRYQKLKTGECHLINEPSPTDIQSMLKNKHLKVLQAEGLNVGYLAFNVEKPPFHKREVRQAIFHALNRRSYLQAIYQKRATLAENPIPPTMWSYLKNSSRYDYNISKAKDLLTQAGYPNGFTTELWTLPVSRPYNPQGKKMGEMMQADLAKIGIKVKLISYDWGTYLAKAKEGHHDMIQLGWTGDNGDPDNFMGVLLGCAGVKSGSNSARWCYQPFEKIIQQAKQETDLKKRTALYEEAQRIFKAEVPWVTLAHSRVYKVMSKNVEGFVIDPLGGNIFHQVELK